jgi:hypothetical protein
VVGSFVEVLLSNSRSVIRTDQDFDLFVHFLRNRYQHVVVLLTASIDMGFEYSNFRLFPERKKKRITSSTDWQHDALLSG